MYLINVIFTARKRSLGQGNIFSPVYHSVHRGRGGVRGRGVYVITGGHVCMVAGRHAWLQGAVRGCGGHSWLGGVRGCRGACMVAGGYGWDTMWDQ